MSSADPLPSPPSAPVAPAWISGIGEALLLWLSFLVYSAIAAPLPALNEPHYLTKAKHFWSPDWCANDMFLQSANAHTVFYATLGALTVWCSLTTVAWIGRAASLLVVAMGWSQLARGLSARPGASLAAAWCFLALQTVGNFSGEWIVGGVESKVFAYGFLFWGWGALLKKRPIASAAWHGLAIAFHPVVGLWGLMATLGAVLFDLLREVLSPKATTRRQAMDHTPANPPGRQDAVAAQRGLLRRVVSPRAVAAVAVLMLTALPGLVPVWSLLSGSVDPLTRYSGTYLQVYYRLAHHLDPMVFPGRAYAGYGLLILVWLIGWRWQRHRDRWNWYHQVIACSLVFAVAGILVGAGPRPPKEMPWFDVRMHLLKFYPFRLADTLVPMAVAWIAVDAWLARSITSRWSAGVVVLVIAGSLGGAWSQGQAGRYTRAQEPAWQDVCRWFREQSPTDSIVQTPHDRYTFKWYAHRSEYVTFKDCPQDPAGIVEWNRRMRLLSTWFQTHYDDHLYSTAELQELRRETGITHIVTDRLGPMEPAATYQSGPYRVYDLTRLE